MVWLAGPDGDQAFARELGLRLAREPALAELELMYGSWDPPGARLLDVVDGAGPAGLARAATRGCGRRPASHDPPTAGPVPAGGGVRGVRRDRRADLDALREELGDVLLQVVLHARLAEDADRPVDRRRRGRRAGRQAGPAQPARLRRRAGRRRRGDHRELGADQAGGEGPRLGAWTASRWPSPPWRWPPRSSPGPSGAASPVAVPAPPVRADDEDELGAGAVRAGRGGAGGGLDAEAALRRRTRAAEPIARRGR